MTSSWFLLSTLNYDARSTAHQIHAFCLLIFRLKESVLQYNLDQARETEWCWRAVASQDTCCWHAQFEKTYTRNDSRVVQYRYRRWPLSNSQFAHHKHLRRIQSATCGVKLRDQDKSGLLSLPEIAMNFVPSYQTRVKKLTFDQWLGTCRDEMQSVAEEQKFWASFLKGSFF